MILQISINFLGSFRGAEFVRRFEKQAKEKALDTEAAAEKMIIFKEATGV